MSATLGSFTAGIAKLRDKFEADKAYYLSKGYSEAQARVDFITPFFKALGWDVENEAGLAHHDREVLVEKGEAETEGRPDYNFRLGGQTKFFVEAKAPSEPLDASKHVLQAKGYAWNTKQVFFVILTDFEEFRFYDASLKPDERKPDEGLLLKLSYTGYASNLEKLWEFSRERVAAGSLNAMLPRDRRTERLRIPVDAAFLDEMTGWREDLARNVYKNNPELTAKQLNEVVQRLLDRIVFIRIAEDRNIIRKYQLREAKEYWEARGGKFHIFEWLNDLFHRINDDFNGEIFKPHLSEEIKIDSEVLARVIERLYPPKSPYRFDVIGVELLGSIYERYLGKTIRPTAKQVRVEEKPEVRKAGGVYYTPKYIVDYIVKNTVGKIIEGKSPKQIEKIRILDPACGSGSFLIGAFQCLIDYHVRYLAEHPKEAHVHPLFPDLIKGENGEPRLSVIRKARILRNNLFGVDIDPQAVEITMMSLYLKALEGEKSQLPPKHALLPELKYNIIYGNSLIGPDIYKDVQLGFFGDEECERINAFDWFSVGRDVPMERLPEETAHQPPGDQLGVSIGAERLPKETAHRAVSTSGPATFGDIMRSGGFDGVIGNPPYVRIQHMKEWAPVEVEYYKEHYKAASSGNYDIYVCFVEKGLSALNEKGRLGFILPHKFFNSKYGEPLREVISSRRHLSSVVHFGDQQVFEGATNYTCLLFLDKHRNNEFEFQKVEDLQAWRESGKATKGTIAASRATAAEWNFTVGKGAQLFEKLGRMPVKLGDVAVLFVGLQTDADDVFILEEVRRQGKLVLCNSDYARKEYLFEDNHLKPFLKGSLNVRRYCLTDVSKRLIFPYEVKNGKSVLIDAKDYKGRFPRTWAYLEQCRARLAGRNKGRMGREWYGYVYEKNHARFGQPKLLVPSIATGSCFAFDPEGVYYFVGSGGGGGGGYGIVPRSQAEVSFQYLLGVLNSRLLSALLKAISTPFRGGYLALNRQYIEQLPIRTINFSDPEDKARHDKMVALVERMLELNKQKHSGSVAAIYDRRVVEHSSPLPLEREIAATDAEIDNLVYELYGITAEERKIIEGT